MRTLTLIAALTGTLITGLITAPAHSAAANCTCPGNTSAQAQKLLNDSSVALARVYVRGTNPRIGQSMLELRETLHGGLSARDFRAKFSTQSCGTLPKARTEQTLLIKFEKDGTYSIMDNCDTQAVLTNIKERN